MILVAGSANIDFVTRVQHIPAPGETVLGGSYSVSGGGKGANQAVACARAGGKVAFLGALGHDPFADTLRQSLRESGVQDLSVPLALPTGAAFISVSEAGENAITVASGANAGLLPNMLPELTGFTHLVMQLEIPLSTVLACAQAARTAGVKVILNAAPAADLPPELPGSVDLLVVNEGELASLVGPGERHEQLRRAARLGPAQVIVTLGAKGSLALDSLAPNGEAFVTVPARRVAVLDTTGAGDTYVGALVASLSGGALLPGAMRFAGTAAALACTRPGAQPSMPTRAEIEAALLTPD